MSTEPDEYRPFTSKLDAALAQKCKLREMEKQFAAEDCIKRGQFLATARKLAGSDEALQSLLTWLEVFLPLGAHPTYIVQAWAAWQYRQRLSQALEEQP